MGILQVIAQSAPQSCLSDIGEDTLLRHFQQIFPPSGNLCVGPGDDCAVVACHGSDWDQLLKTDAVVEGVHFYPGELPQRVGHKALARVLSDFAAMGGEPCHVLVTLALPKTTPLDWLEGFYAGLLALAEKYPCRVAGGELSAVPTGSSAVVSIAATGRVPRGKAVLRSGGRPGDVLAVTGYLGASLPSGRHLDFDPRLPAGQWLAAQSGVAAMMDLSDGLARDLPRLARASQCAYELHPESIPCHQGCTPEQAWNDGEDYELLVAIRPADWPTVAAGFAHTFPSLPLTQIGNLQAPDPAQSLNNTGGWDHFSASAG